MCVCVWMGKGEGILYVIPCTYSDLVVSSQNHYLVAFRLFFLPFLGYSRLMKRQHDKGKHKMGAHSQTLL